MRNHVLALVFLTTVVAMACWIFCWTRGDEVAVDKLMFPPPPAPLYRDEDILVLGDDT